MSALFDSSFTVAGRIGRCRTEETIVVAGSPRSGTTLLMEVLATLPDYKTINEPLIRVHLRDKYGFYDRTYMEVGDRFETRRTFLDQVLRGQIGPDARWHFRARSSPGILIEHSTRQKLVVKFCRLNRMLPWFANEFTVRGVVFLIRHPCAVVSSMIRYGQWENWKTDLGSLKRDLSSAISINHLPDSVKEVFSPLLQRTSTQLEALTLIWCLDHYFPLIHAQNHPWILVPYERLIMKPGEELGRIAQALEIDVTEAMAAALHRPSSSVMGSMEESAQEQLSKWKKHLSRQEVEQILRMVADVGLSSFYSSAVEPHYERLNYLQRPASRWADG